VFQMGVGRRSRFQAVVCGVGAPGKRRLLRPVKSMKPKQRILIVDDESGLVRLMKLVLERTDRYQVHGETDPTAALEVAMRFQPDLILLDLIMPGIDGRELAERFRATQGLQTKPIIFVSAVVPRSEGIASRIAGFPALAKPLGMNDLVALVDASCPAPPRAKQKPKRGRAASRTVSQRRGKKAKPKKDEKLKALIARVFACVSGAGGTLAPTRESKILNVDRKLRILSMTETWTYAPSKVLHLRIDRAKLDLAICVTVSVNTGTGRQFEESEPEELVAHIREQVALLTA
jgi:DNA-binding response OmpR family regulator